MGPISDRVWKWNRDSRAFAEKLILDDSSSFVGETSNGIPGKDPEFGTSAVIKTWYEGKNSNQGQFDWVESPPKQLNKKIAKSHDRVAIKLYKVKDAEKPTIAGRTPLKIYHVQLQSPLLVTALKDILTEVDHFVEATEPASFMEPFKPLFFSYDKIMALYHKTDNESLLKQHLRLLVQVLGELFGGFIANLKNLKASGLISYKLAWTYFAKDSVIFSGSSGTERVCRVVSTTYETEQIHRMAINCQELSFDGDGFDWKPIRLYIPRFAGNQLVVSLPSYPLAFHLDKENIKERLTVRAKKVLEYQALHYCEYAGLGIHIEGCKVQKHNVNGRILIDYFGYQKHHDGVQPKAIKPIPVTDPMDLNYDTLVTQTEVAEDKTEELRYVKRLSKERQQKNIDEMLERNDDLIFVSPMLAGFALKNKLWLNFYVDDLKPVNWNDDAYGHLVYPEEQKDLVLTFVQNHQHVKFDSSDVIMGKGQGLILLLSGPPGTGKTLTAEAVADKTRRPLYYLQAEDLGTDAAYLGTKIKKVFEMATEWDAVVLLDEADVFMAERTVGDIARNELVSIFLKSLEYYQGIIFLTTNLYSTIDVAFRSRVDIHLLFQQLPAPSRRVLWQKFLSRLPPPSGAEPSKVGIVAGVSEEDLTELSKWELNGREIKNAIKTVRTWCLCKSFDINLLRLESGIRVTAPQALKQN